MHGNPGSTQSRGRSMGWAHARVASVALVPAEWLGQVLLERHGIRQHLARGACPETDFSVPHSL